MGIERILWEIPLAVAYQLVGAGLWKNGVNLRRPFFSSSSTEFGKIEKLLGI